MAAAVLNLGIYSPAELRTLLDVAKAEYARRLTDGRVTQGSSAAQSYGMTVMTVDDLIRFMNGIAAQLGLDTTNVRAAPNFNTRSAASPFPYGGGYGPC